MKIVALTVETVEKLSRIALTRFASMMVFVTWTCLNVVWMVGTV